MAKSRLDLHQILVDILGSPNVYFQPPTNLTMKYPCIRYSWDSSWSPKADDKKYVSKKRYTLTVIDKNPDSPIPSKLEELPFCSIDRTYQADNLNHFVYTIYF